MRDLVEVKELYAKKRINRNDGDKQWFDDSFNEYIEVLKSEYSLG